MYSCTQIKRKTRTDTYIRTQDVFSDSSAACLRLDGWRFTAEERIIIRISCVVYRLTRTTGRHQSRRVPFIRSQYHNNDNNDNNMRVNRYDIIIIIICGAANTINILPSWQSRWLCYRNNNDFNVCTRRKFPEWVYWRFYLLTHNSYANVCDRDGLMKSLLAHSSVVFG